MIFGPFGQILRLFGEHCLLKLVLVWADKNFSFKSIETSIDAIVTTAIAVTTAINMCARGEVSL